MFLNSHTDRGTHSNTLTRISNTQTLDTLTHTQHYTDTKYTRNTLALTHLANQFLLINIYCVHYLHYIVAKCWRWSIFVSARHVSIFWKLKVQFKNSSSVYSVLCGALNLTRINHTQTHKLTHSHSPVLKWGYRDQLMEKDANHLFGPPTTSRWYLNTDTQRSIMLALFWSIVQQNESWCAHYLLIMWTRMRRMTIIFH